MVEVQTRTRHKGLKTYGDREYISLEFQKFLRNEGIHHQIKTSHTPRQNNVMECKNRTFLNMAWRMLQLAILPPKFWEEPIGMTFYIQNRGCHRSLGQILLSLLPILLHQIKLWHHHPLQLLLCRHPHQLSISLWILYIHNLIQWKHIWWIWTIKLITRRCPTLSDDINLLAKDALSGFDSTKW